MSYTSRRTWAFRLCSRLSRPYSNEIFNFFQNWSSFVWLPIVRSKVYACQLPQRLSWVWQVFDIGPNLIFEFAWKFVWGKNPSFRGPSWMKSCPNCQAKWCWVIQVLTPMTSHRFRDDSMWRNPWFFPKIQLNPLVQKNRDSKFYQFQFLQRGHPFCDG